MSITLKNANHVPLCDVTSHPHQADILATGDFEGKVDLWDLRRNAEPFTSWHQHKAPIWEVRFHPTQPQYVYSCSEDMQVLLWALSGSNVTEVISEEGSGYTPINAIDIDQDNNALAACTDGGALLLTPALRQ